jgi:hypothetical protein
MYPSSSKKRSPAAKAATAARRQAVLDQVALKVGKLERVTKIAGHKGPVGELYKLANGKTVRPRTNSLRELFDTTRGGPKEKDASAKLCIEQDDFVGVGIPAANGDGTDVYLVPSARAAADLKSGHRFWLKHSESGGPTNMRVIRFNDDMDKTYAGFAIRYAEFLIGTNVQPATTSPVATAPNDCAQFVEGHRRQIAEHLGLSESAVNISIRFGG